MDEMLSKKQLSILSFPNSDYDALICDGAVRSGKTSVMSVAFVLWAMRDFDGCVFGICGKTVQTAARNVVQPLLNMAYMKKRFYMKFNRSSSTLVISNGKHENTFYLYGGKDESSYMLIQGITLAGVFLDEVALMTRSFVEQAIARCSVEGSRFWFNCNPSSPGHWFYKEWILKAEQKNSKHIHFLMTDNPSLSQKTIERYESLYTGVFYDRYIQGMWCVADGLVYRDAFDVERNVVDELPESGEYYVSIDYGTLNPFSAGLWCVFAGKAYRIKEYYYSGRESTAQMTDEEYYTQLVQLVGNLKVKQVIIDPSAASFIATIRKHGNFMVRKAKNDVMGGIRCTSALLKSGKILLSRTCEDSIREFGLYSWDAKSSVDKVLKENDHAMDDIRYFCYTILRHKKEFAGGK